MVDVFITEQTGEARHYFELYSALAPFSGKTRSSATGLWNAPSKSVWQTIERLSAYWVCAIRLKCMWPPGRDTGERITRGRAGVLTTCSTAAQTRASMLDSSERMGERGATRSAWSCATPNRQW
jgi:hypothetical protein